MNFTKAITSTFLILLLSFAALWAGTNHPQTNCPVMGGKINKHIYADYDGKRVYFCCSACVSEFEKHPDKYVKKLEGDGITLESVPTSMNNHDKDHEHEKK